MMQLWMTRFMNVGATSLTNNLIINGQKLLETSMVGPGALAVTLKKRL